MTNNSYNQYIKLLKEFVSFKSVSTDSKFQPEIEKTVDWLNNTFLENKFKVKVVRPNKTNPVVIASYKVKEPNSKTLLIYGHYDVQPAEKNDGWKSDPFNLSVTDKKLYARGVVDNKGQVLIHIFNAISLIKKGQLKYNLIFLIEGNEETSNPDLAKIIAKNRKLLKCDYVIISDGELTNRKPTVEVSLRGGFNLTLEYKTGANNLHSGIYGGAVPSAPLELNRFLNKLFSSDGQVTYKGFYDLVDKVLDSELKNNKALFKSASDIAKVAGVKKLLLSKNTDFFTATGLLPTIQITGFKSGYIETGYANIVPAKAEVRLNFRIVSSQKPAKVLKDFKRFVKQNTPKYVDYTISSTGLHDPVKVDINNDFVKDVSKMLKQVYKSKINYKNVGGAIPVVSDFKNTLKVNTLLVPIANEDCNMHGVDENFDTDLIKKGLEFSLKLLSN